MPRNAADARINALKTASGARLAKQLPLIDFEYVQPKVGPAKRLAASRADLTLTICLDSR